MTTVQILLLIGAGFVVWLLAVALIILWVMGMSRNAAVDEDKFTRDLAAEKKKAARRAAARARRTSV